MPDINGNKHMPELPDEDSFYKAVKFIEDIAKQSFQAAAQQRDIIMTQEERYAVETAALRSRIEKKDSELEGLRKKLIDSQMKLSEYYRTENSLKLEVRQHQAQLDIYRVDAKKIAELEEALRSAKDANTVLQSQIEAMRGEAERIARDRKSELDKLSLKYEQEKIILGESIQIAEDKAKNAAEIVERYKAAASLAEQEKNAALESTSRAKQDLKQQVEKMREEVARREAMASEQERSIADMQRSYERKITLAESTGRQEYQAQVESLKTTVEEQAHELNRLRYQLEQMKEDHKRTLETMKQDMEKQLELRAAQIRRQYILNTAPKNEPLQQ